MEKYFLAALQSTTGIGSETIKKLLAHFGKASVAWQASKTELQASNLLNLSQLKNLLRQQKTFDLTSQVEFWQKKEIKIVSIFEDDYPSLLKEIYNPPLLLFYRGKMEVCQKKCLAIVGARKFSAYGRSIAHNLGRDLAANGYTVVSGAAYGIDTAAQKGALLGGTTAAVLGCGVDIAYPRENQRLLAQIAEQGVVLSEYLPGTRPKAGYFPARNRIISGLSRGVVVVEAARRSGSLITAEMALNAGRDVFAVPGSIYSEQSEGCNHLIQEGAKLITSAFDVLQEYEGRENICTFSAGKLNLTAEEAKVYAVLTPDKPLSLDELVAKLRMRVSHISFVLLQMKLKNIVTEVSTGSYIRRTGEKTIE